MSLNWDWEKIEPYGLFYRRFSFTVTCMDTVENIMCSCTATTPPKWKQRMALVLPRLISERGSSLGSCLREYVLIVYILLKYTMDCSLRNSSLYTKYKIIKNLWCSSQSMFYNSNDLLLLLSAFAYPTSNVKELHGDNWHWNILHTIILGFFSVSRQVFLSFL